MQSRDHWQSVVQAGIRDLGFNEGYRLLYCPWNVLDEARIVFVSLNPGRPPSRENTHCIDDERGNSYEVESLTTVSPITDQFLRMCAFLSVPPAKVLTGVAAPYRSDTWGTLTMAQRAGSLKIGRAFWREALSHRTRDLIVTCSTEAEAMAVEITNAKLGNL